MWHEGFVRYDVAGLADVLDALMEAFDAWSVVFFCELSSSGWEGVKTCRWGFRKSLVSYSVSKDFVTGLT